MKKIGFMRAAIAFSMLLFAHNSYSQSLESVFDKFKSSKSLKIELKQSEESYSLQISGDKYRLSGDQIDVIFDGENLYSYNKSSNEVLIEKPSSEALMSSPSNLFKLNLDSFTVEGDKRGYYSLTPKDSESIGVKLLYVEISGNDLKTINVTTTNDDFVDFTINSVDFNAKFSSDIFEYNKKDYPRAEIVDFR